MTCRLRGEQLVAVWLVEVFSSSGPLVSLRGVISFLDDPEGSSFNSFTFFPEMSLSELLSDSGNET